MKTRPIIEEFLKRPLMYVTFKSYVSAVSYIRGVEAGARDYDFSGAFQKWLQEIHDAPSNTMWLYSALIPYGINIPKRLENGDLPEKESEFFEAFCNVVKEFFEYYDANMCSM